MPNGGTLGGGPGGAIRNPRGARTQPVGPMGSGFAMAKGRREEQPGALQQKSKGAALGNLGRIGQRLGAGQFGPPGSLQSGAPRAMPRPSTAVTQRTARW